MSDPQLRQASRGVALVLGAGGPVGRAFHAGVLRALADECGWDARHADLIVGTSAGAQVGALLRAGSSAHDLYAHAMGDRGSSAEGAALVWAWPAGLLPLPDGARASWPGSSSYLRRAMRRPWLARPGRLIAAALPEGTQDSEPLGQAFARIYEERWPVRPLWITAVHFDGGARVIFGQKGAPEVDVGTAVRCSSAVPGLRRPVRVGAARYIDGGIASATHADLVAQANAPHAPALRLVVVSSPLSRFAVLRLLLRAELRGLRRHGVAVALFEPDRQVAAAMGWNPMDARLAPRLTDLAYRSTLARLRRHDASRLRRSLGA